MRHRRADPTRSRSITQQAPRHEDVVTGQTGSGQARLTLGGLTSVSTARCEWSPAERFASGSARQVSDHVQQGRLQRSSLFLVHALQRHRLLIDQRPNSRGGHRRQIQIPLAIERKSLQRVRRRILSGQTPAWHACQVYRQSKNIQGRTAKNTFDWCLGAATTELGLDAKLEERSESHRTQCARRRAQMARAKRSLNVLDLP